mgnify:FL=1
MKAEGRKKFDKEFKKHPPKQHPMPCPIEEK